MIGLSVSVLSASLFLVAVLALLSGGRLASLRQRYWLVALALAACMAPWPWGVAHWFMSVFSELSITTGLIALFSLLNFVGVPRLFPRSEQRVLAIGLCLVAPWFYALSLGLWSLDPYAWGLGDYRFSTALLVLGLLLWVNRWYGLCLMLVLAEVAFHFQWLASDNLWDYLLDPALVLWAAFSLVTGRYLPDDSRDTGLDPAAD